MKPPRRLDPEEKALWRQVARTVTPLPKRARAQQTALDESDGPTKRTVSPSRKAAVRPIPVESMTPQEWKVGSKLRVNHQGSARLISTGHAHGQAMAPGAASLDGGWDRRIRRGAIRPDRSIDLHGYTLNQAHHLLDRALADALRDEVRVLLVITGKEPKAGSGHGDFYGEGDGPQPRRGVIRASMADWLSHSRHAAMIAAVRNAHPRDGGSGALYVILRRKRP